MAKFLVFIFLSIGLYAGAQQNDDSTKYVVSKTTYGLKYNRMAIDSIFYLPNVDTLFTPFRQGAIVFKRSNKKPYVWNGSYWVELAAGSGSQTWQQTLTATGGSTLTQNNTIAGGGFDLKFNNSNFYVGTLGGNSNRLVWNDNNGLLYNTTMQIVADTLQPYLLSGDTSFTWSVDSTVNDPPVGTGSGSQVRVGTSPTGVFIGHANEIATSDGAGGFTYQTAAAGDLLYDANTDLVSKFNGSVWTVVGRASIHQGGDRLGAIISIGATDNFGFKVKTNNVSRLGIRSNGIFDFYSLNGTGNTLMALSSAGQASRFTGSTGSFPYFSATNVISNQTIGTTGQHLVVSSGGIPIWQDTTAVPSAYVSTFSAGTTGFTPNSATSGAVTLAGTLVLANGGTNANLTASNGGIFYSTATAGAILSGTATANKMLLSGATAAPTWSTSTIPSSAGATANKVLLSDGTNYVLSTPTFPNASATSGKIIISDGTNWIASTPTYPSAAGTSGNVLTSDGTNWTSAAPAGGGVTTLAAIGSSPNANGATISGTTLNLEPASASFGGVVTTGTQTIAGAKTWSGAATFSGAVPTAITFNGSATATANSQSYFNTPFNFTARATVSDVLYGINFNPTLTANSTGQTGVAVRIFPTYASAGGTFTGQVALEVNGTIRPTGDATMDLGQNALRWRTVSTDIVSQVTNIRMLSGSSLLYTDGSSGSVSRLLVTGDQVWAANGDLPAATNGYKIQPIGEASITGGIVVPALITAAGSVANVGVTGATTYTYVIVAKLTNGGVSPSANITTTTGNATLTGSNLNRITITDVPGARRYDIYRTVGGATQGKIGTRSVQGATSFDDNGLAGDGSTAPTTNSTGNLGLATITPNSILHVNGSAAFGYVAKTATYTATVNDYTIECTANTFTVTLPTAVGITGRIYNVVNSGAGTITIGTTSSQTFVNVVATPTTLTLAAVGSVMVQSNGANWMQLK
jgi:hypothetical protein